MDSWCNRKVATVRANPSVALRGWISDCFAGWSTECARKTAGSARINDLDSSTAAAVVAESKTSCWLVPSLAASLTDSCGSRCLGTPLLHLPAESSASMEQSRASRVRSLHQVPDM